MRRHTHFLSALLVVVASACQQDGISGPMTVATPNLSAASGGVETNVRVPFDLFVDVACANGGAGEVIALSGTLHSIFNVLVDGNGGFHVKVHDQPQGLSGTGLTTGDKYQGVGGTREHLNVKAGETFTYVNNFRMIGQGPGNNFSIHETFHGTINANGTVTAEHGQFVTSCK